MKYRFFILFSLLILFGLNTYAQTDEYAIKAAFIEKFTRFIDWPQSSNVNNNSKPIVVSVIGTNPFGKKLNEIYSTNKIKNKNVQIRYISKISEIEGCDILFISTSKKNEILDLLAYTQDKPILTISDTEGYEDVGVIINFYLENNKIRFEINETALSQSGLKSSFMLLNLAKIVKPIKK